MSVAQGSTEFNTEYYTSMTNRINSASSCSDLQSLVTEIWGSLQGVQDAINSQSALLQPIDALLTAPGANLTNVANWIQTLITSFLTPYYRPYAILAVQLTELTAQVAILTGAVQAMESRFPGCSVNIPTIT